MHNRFDKGYKILFSNKEVIKQFLIYFVEKDFVKYLDFDTLEKVNKSFVSKKGRESESDLIFKINCKNDIIYIYLLLEFQSHIDYKMPIRFLNYITSLYLDIYEKSKNLPAVFPILIYNGKKDWNASYRIQDMIEKNLEDVLIPHFEYFSFEINKMSKENLIRIRQALSFVFYMENTDSPKEIEEGMFLFFNIFKKEQPETFNIIKSWFRNFFLDKDKKEDILLLKSVNNFEELINMYKSVKEKLKDAYYEEGKLKGIEEGEKRGKLKGIEETQTELIINLYINAKMSISEIVLITKTNEDFVIKVLKDNNLLNY